LHSQLIKLEFLKDLIIAEELENLKSIRKAIDDIDKLRQRINFNKFITPTHVPPNLAKVTLVRDDRDQKELHPAKNHGQLTLPTHIPSRIPNPHNDTRKIPSKNAAKATRLSLNILASNCRSFGSKKRSIEQILIENSVDIAIVSELNMKTIPRIKGFFQFCNLSTRGFHGTAIFCQNYLQGQIIRIPDEDEIELVHILVKSTTPMLNLIGVYLDCEGRDNNVDKSCRIMLKLKNKVQDIIAKGQSVLLMGDMNKKINQENKSPSTQLLLEWLKEETMNLLNNPCLSTRIDPVSGKGSTLDLAIVSTDYPSKSTRKKEICTKSILTTFQ